MATTTEYAQIASAVYAKTTENKIYAPTGWTELEWQPDMADGFSAGVYKKSNEIVIGFTGTNEGQVVDWLAANGPLVLGVGSSQLTQAIEMFMRIKNTYPQANISFTGHSLGGGLASLMGVLFDKSTTAFALAPFQKTALNAFVLTAIWQGFKARGMQDEAFDSYIGGINIFGGNDLFATREHNVRAYSIIGEAVSLAGRSLTIVNPSADHWLNAGNPYGNLDFGGAVNLHSMQLHAAILQSSQFAAVLPQLSKQLIPLMFYQNLFARDPQRSQQADLLHHIMRHEWGVNASGGNAITADAMLEQLTKDAQQLASSKDNWNNETLLKGLIKAMFEHYYSATSKNDTPTLYEGNIVKTLFQAAIGGFNFETKQINLTGKDWKGEQDLHTGILEIFQEPMSNRNEVVINELKKALVDIERYNFANSGSIEQTNDALKDFVLAGDTKEWINTGEGDDVVLAQEGDDWVKAGAGNDLLIGSGGQNILDGEEGDDTLISVNMGLSGDFVYGGEGKDTYLADDGDMLIDKDGQGVVYAVTADGQKIKLGDGTRRQGEEFFTSANGIKYKEQGNTIYAYTPAGMISITSQTPQPRVTLANGTEISGQAGMGIQLTTRGEDPGPSTPPFIRTPCPLIFDLNRDGIQTSNLNGHVYFDHAADGFLEHSAWVASADDAFLVLDKNNNGRIDNGNELFGDNTLLADHSKAENGYIALAQYDSNQDKQIDSKDSIFNQLQLWLDVNTNGITDANELKTLSELQIQSIQLSSTYQFVSNNGNHYSLASTYQKTDGSTGKTVDMYFASNNVRSINIHRVFVPEDIQLLPNSIGRGLVDDLHQVMAKDQSGVLKNLVQQFIASDDFEERKNMANEIMLRWADVWDIGASKIAEKYDAQLMALEKNFRDINWPDETNLLNRATYQVGLAESYQRWLGQFFLDLAQDNYLKPILDILHQWSLDQQGTPVRSVNLHAVVNLFQQSLNQNWINTQRLFDEFTYVAQHADLLTTEEALQLRDQLVQIAGNDELTAHFNQIWYSIANTRGNDQFSGNASIDIYSFNRGDGQDIINSLNTNQQDILRFGANMKPEDIQVRFDGIGNEQRDLVLSIKGTTDQIRIQNFFSYNGDPTRAALEKQSQPRIEFASGVQWTLDDIKRLAIQSTDGDDRIVGFVKNTPDESINTLVGGLGNDVLVGNSAADVFIGGPGNDHMEGREGSDIYIYNRGDGIDTIKSGSYRDTQAIDRLRFGAGINPQDVWVQRDQWDLKLYISSTEKITLQQYFSASPEGDANLRIEFSDGTVWNRDDLGQKLLGGTPLDDNITGTDFDDVINAGAGNDSISGGAGNDILNGEAGNDYLNGDDGNDFVMGGDADDSLSGGNGDDQLIGGRGNDQLNGGSGNDVYVYSLSDGSDVVDNRRYNSIDTLRFTDILASQVYLSQRDVYGYNWSGRYTIIEQNLLIQIRNSTDQITIKNFFHTDWKEYYGIDQIQFADGVIYNREKMIQQVARGINNQTPIINKAPEDLAFQAGKAFSYSLDKNTLTDPDLDDQIQYSLIQSDGSSLPSWLSFDAQTLMLSGTAPQTLGALRFKLTGTDLYGKSVSVDWKFNIQNAYTDGDDVIDEAELKTNGSALVLAGGLGNDQYQIINLSTRIVEKENEGIDTLIIKTDQINNNQYVGEYTLPNFVENATLTPITKIWSLIGNQQNNLLDASQSNTPITLDGKAGADTMIGSQGPTSFIIDNIGDQIISNNPQQTDTIRSSIDYALSSKIKNLTLTDNAIKATGNALDNNIIGNAQNNIIEGKQGNDELEGGLGNDTYLYNLGDGIDSIYDSELGEQNTVRLGAGILPQNVGLSKFIGLSKFYNDLIIRFTNSLNDRITIKNFFYNNNFNIVFDNGTQWNGAMLQSRATNQAPVINQSISTQSAIANKAYQFVVPLNTITDPDVGDQVSYELSGVNGARLPAWLSFDPATRTMSGTPTSQDLGSIKLTLWGRDLYGKARSTVFTLNIITPPNLAPTATSTSLGNQSVNEGDALSYVLASTFFKDPEGGALSYKAQLATQNSDGTSNLSNLPSWLTFNATTRTLTGTAPEGLNNYNIRITAIDDAQQTAYADLNLAITAQNLTLNGTSTANTLTGKSGNDTINGNAGNDTLSGKAGNDVINGGSGNDTIIGGLGNDALSGGTGSDIYRYAKGDGSDVIDNLDIGTTRIDILRFDVGILPSDIIAKQLGNDVQLQIKNTSDIITLKNYNLGKNNQINRIEFAGGTSWTSTQIAQQIAANVSTTGFAPLVIDLDGDGLELISAAQSKVQVELDGKKQNIGWASADDALIAIDRNGDGQINIQTETTFIHDKAGAQSDLEGLAGFDHNQDGQISAEDAVWAQLKTWQDQNGDGIAEQNEIKTLEQQNITRIDLQRQGSPTQQNGNTILGTTTAQMRDGTTKQIGDVVFNPESSTNLNATQTQTTANTGELQLTEAELRAAFPLSYAAVKDAEQAKALGIDITPQPSKSKRGAQAVIDYYQAQEPKKTLTQSLIGLAKRMVGLESPDEKTKRINDANFFKMLIQFEDTCYMGIDKHGKPYNIPMLWKSSKYANPHYPIHLIEQEDRQAQLEEMFTRASNYPAYKAKMDQQAQAAEKNKAPPTQRELAEAETQRLHKQYASFMYERYSRLIASEQLGTSSAPLSAQTQFTSNQPSINTIAPMMGMGVDVKGK